MIKFFRKIRQKMIAENKFSKYVMYAVGEIVLVVIGILIALQINIRNQADKDSVYEIKMLTEIENGLELDLANLHEHYETYSGLKNTVDYFTRLTQNKVVFQDSLMPALWKLNTGRYLNFNRGPYDALKSSGIDRVSNDSVRNHLINFFDFRLLEFQTTIDHSTRRYRSNVDLLLSFREDPFIDEDDNWVVNRVPRDILQRPKFVWLLTDIDWRVSSSKAAIESFTPKMEALIALIHSEIDRD
jgi:hypothetical protein